MPDPHWNTNTATLVIFVEASLSRHIASAEARTAPRELGLERDGCERVRTRPTGTREPRA